MTKEDRELLLKDLSARVPYGVKIEGYELHCVILNSDWLHFMYTHQEFAIRRPYLRPMSSMTEEEMDKIEEILGDKCIFDFMGNGDVSLHQGDFTQNILSKLYDFYNSIHVDYRGLISKGLALQAPEGMYNIKKK